MTVYRIPGRPIALARPRFSKTTGKVFDSQRETKFLWGVLLKQQRAGNEMLHGPIYLRVKFSFYTEDQALHGKPYPDVPDLSNLIKFVEDVATGILYDDDSLVTLIEATKIWSEGSCTEFIISEIT